MIKPKLFAISYEQDGSMDTIFSVEVDMDDETAELRVLKEVRNILDDQDISLEDSDIGEIIWEQVPDAVDRHEINIERRGR